MKVHKLAELFPAMPPDEYEALKQDVKAHGVLVPIVVYAGEIIDGRHRWQAAQETGKKCPKTEWEPTSASPDDIDAELWGYLLSLNSKRRHLDKSQIAMIAVEGSQFIEDAAKERQRRKNGDTKPNESKTLVEATLPQGDKTRTPQARDEIAEKAGVSGRTIQKAKNVRDADPKLAEKVKQGKITVTEAEREIKKITAPERPKPVDKPATDGADKPITDEKVAEAFAEAGIAEGKEIQRAISAIKSRIKAFSETLTGSYLEGPAMGDIASSLDQIRVRVRDAMPHTTCPQMPNCKRACKLCGGRRFISVRHFNTPGIMPKEQA